MDIVNQMLTLEQDTKNFQKHASKMIYESFLDLLSLADTDQLCAVSDSYYYSQTIRTPFSPWRDVKLKK